MAEHIGDLFNGGPIPHQTYRKAMPAGCVIPHKVLAVSSRSGKCLPQNQIEYPAVLERPMGW